jgi:hypothetical protein
MDDFNIASLNESRNEWCVRLVNILTPCIIGGFKSIFTSAVQMCKENNEMDKYMMTFQNLISRIPSWTDHILEKEQQTIVTNSKCNYLEELITCVHIIQMKVLSAVRVSSKQKKIDVNIPKLSKFIHNIYINAARKIYTNVYLFKLNDPPLQVQKNERELELIVRECIFNTIRDSIPIEELLKAYLSETTEDIIEYKDEIIEEPAAPQIPKEHVKVGEIEHEKEPLRAPSPTPAPSLSFNDVDNAVTPDNVSENISAPKTIERLEEISVMRNNQRKAEEEEENDDEPPASPICFESGPVDLSMDLEVLDAPAPPMTAVSDDLDLGEIEILS